MKDRIHELLTLADAAGTPDGKGTAFENVLEFIFSNIPGLEIIGRDVVDVHRAEEIDLALLNREADGGIFHLLDVRQILSECKFWSNLVSSHEIAAFINKMRQRDVKVGFLVAALGITGDAASLTSAHQEISAALLQGFRVIVITRYELEQINDAADFVALIKRKVGLLLTKRTSIA